MDHIQCFLCNCPGRVSSSKKKANDDAAEVELFTIQEALQLDLAFDHYTIINDAMNVLKKEMSAKRR